MTKRSTTIAVALSLDLHLAIALLLPTSHAHAATKPSPPTPSSAHLFDIDETATTPTSAPHVETSVPRAPSVAGLPAMRRAPLTVHVSPHPVAPGEPPPPAARAGAVLAALVPAPSSPAFVEAKASSFAGGVTQAGGTSEIAVTDPSARAWGVLGGAGTGGGGLVSSLDGSRPASLGGRREWRCPFPPEAADVDHAIVHVRADVLLDGRAAGVTVLDDPGWGFGREAVRCALLERYVFALDRDGRPTRGWTRPFRVYFDRWEAR